MNRFLFVLVLFSMLVFSAGAQDSAVLEANLTAECVTEFDASVDYFPEKAEITAAENFSVDYSGNYKVVTVNGSTQTYTYVLVQCGTPTPAGMDFPANTRFIEIPVERTITLATTQVIHLIELGVLDSLVGMDSFLYISAAEVREMIAADVLEEVSPNFELNIEVLLDTEPDIVMMDDYDPGRADLLAEVGITGVVNADYLESDPLGRAEWLKFSSLFYNAEAVAADAYSEIASAYNEARELAATVPEDDRPVILWNAISPFSDTWGLPGPGSFAGVLIEDAGGIIALADEAPDGIAYLSLEVVYDGALDADVWITNLFGVAALDGLLAIDSRYADFAAVQNGNVWNNSLDVSENGGNNYYELGVTNPHLILQDLVAIFHPELLPDHEFAFHEPLE